MVGKTFLLYFSIETWNKKIVESDKLRTYRKFKTTLGKEWCCILPLSRDHRRVLFNLRSCSLPLAIETGRYSKPKTPLNERLCKFCQLNTLEDDTHFLIDCELYSDLRQLLFERAVFLNENFENLSSTEKLSFFNAA